MDESGSSINISGAWPVSRFLRPTFPIRLATGTYQHVDPRLCCAELLFDREGFRIVPISQLIQDLLVVPRGWQ